MTDPAVAIFEVVRDHLGRKHKIEWKKVQSLISKRSKENKINNAEAKQQVFAEISECVNKAADELFLFDLGPRLSAALFDKFGSDSDVIAAEIIQNNPDAVSETKELICNSFGKMEHGLGEKQWSMIEAARRILSECMRLGEKVGYAKAKEEVRAVLENVLPPKPPVWK